MPELPEVQTTVNGIRKYLRGLVIRDVWTDYDSPSHAGKDNIKNPDFFKKFRKTITGAKIIDAERRGKNVLINLSNGRTIIVHMKMTGHLMHGRYERKNDKWIASEEGPLRDDPSNRFVHVVFSLSDGKYLVLSDMRKFAKITIGKTRDIHNSLHLFRHGPEPLDRKFTSNKLRETLSGRPNAPIKTALMNPELVSGIGNIYSDEILWKAGINPLEKVINIPVKKWPSIWKTMKQALKSGIDFGGDSMSDYRNIKGEKGKFQERHRAYRKTGTKCSKPGCKGTITRIKLGGRSAHFCDRHQKIIRK